MVDLCSLPTHTHVCVYTHNEHAHAQTLLMIALHLKSQWYLPFCYE